MEESSGSDFDDDEDPDKIQVPGKFVAFSFCGSNSFHLLLGGGMNLSAAAGILESRDGKNKQESTSQGESKLPNVMAANKSLANMPPGAYDMMRNPQSE